MAAILVGVFLYIRVLGSRGARLMATAVAPLHGPREVSLGTRVQRAVDRWLLPIYVLGVTVYLVLPVAVMIAVQLQRPGGPIEPAMGLVLVRRVAGSARPARPAGGRRATASSSRSSSTIVATILGTLIALALVRYDFRGRGSTNLLIFLPMSTPEIVLGASLLTTFIASVDLPFIPSGVVYPLSILTIILAHIMFSISFVVVTVKARLSGFPRHLEEAAMDLGRQRVDDVLEGDVPARSCPASRPRRCWRSACRSTTTSSRASRPARRRRSRCTSTGRSCAASRCRSTSSGPSSSSSRSGSSC